MTQTPSQYKALTVSPSSILSWIPKAGILAYLLACLAILGAVLIQPPAGMSVARNEPGAVANAWVLYLVAFVFLFSGIRVFAVRHAQSEGLAFAVFCGSAALAIGLQVDQWFSQRLSLLWMLGVAFSTGALFSWVLQFPGSDPRTRRLPWLHWAGYLVSILIFAGWVLGTPLPRGRLEGLAFACLGICAFFALVWQSLRLRQTSSPIERDQIRLVLAGSLLALAPLTIWLLVSLVLPDRQPYSAYLALPLMIFPVVTNYAIQRFRLVYTDYILNRVTLYGMMAFLVMLGYACLASGLSLIFAGSIQNQPLLSGLIFFMLSLGILPLRQSLQNTLDAVFFRGQRVYQERLQTFSGDLTTLVDLPSILQTLRSSIEQSLMPSVLHIYIYDPLTDRYSATPDEKKHPTSDLKFSSASPIVTLLSQQRYPIFVSETNSLDQARLSLLGAEVYAPLSGRARLAGWLALGQRLSGDAYTSRELGFLDSLCDQAALAIERAQVIVNMETRIRETNVLARVAQGVNITLTLDDTLELVYTQVTQVIPADDFHVMLLDRASNQLVEVFYVFDDERYSQYENRPASSTSLEEEVVRQRRPILTTDYNRECQKRGILSTKTGIYGWVSVPLNAGAETIGAISLGNHDPEAPYTQEQAQLLQAIADQFAGALVKVRLLQETERRARQLSTLNEVTRQLTSTLDLEPLLYNILKSAVDILNCEAGSLLLVDETSGNMVFRATTGPVASNLLNQSLPAGIGIVGKAVKEKAPVIINDAQNSPEWFQKTDQQTGFATRALMVIPLLANDQVIGVIEVLNKKDGTNFSTDELELLSTFAAQASVAVKNARQFTLTDQALAARVEELSVMQRIDRELNTSLDVSTTMKIALDWAMRQSGAAAGLIGVVTERGLQIMASQGYKDELDPYQSAPLAMKDTQFQSVIESRTAQSLALADDSSHPIRLLAGTARQVILPIQREGNTIGLMLLESTSAEPVSEETLAFLQRLGDHASIAISNAQLYAAIQAANVAKSEFVSFVAHELKNPMTSIKGYTELLAGKAVGPVNEPQANFLATIRSNIERMNTLISDLNDVSKIEAGRLRLEFKAQSLSSVVEETVRSTRRQIEEKGQQLSLQVPADLANLWADRTRLSQVLVNLVSNAHKYTPQGGQILVGAEACDNRWDPAGAPRVVHIWVKDNGIGIAPEDQKKIFQKFFRSEDPKTREVPGTGLGLNITRSLVEMQGGRIWFESEYRVGTTFHFTVPIAE